MSGFAQVKKVIDSFEKIVSALREKGASTELIESIEYSKRELNNLFYHSPCLKFQKTYNLEIREELAAYIEEINTLLQMWRQSLQNSRRNSADAEFYTIYEFFKYVDTESIYQRVVKKFLDLPQEFKDAYMKLEEYYPFLEHRINYETNEFSLIRHLTELMAERVESYKWLYEHLADNRSKVILNGIISFWFEFDLEKLYALEEKVFSEYFDLDLLNCDESTTVVDLGAFIGDTIKKYLDTYKIYKKIYAYEITQSTFQVLKENVQDLPNMVLVNKGVSDTSGKMCVSQDLFAGNKLLETGDVMVDVVTLDEDITEPISVLKMDIEGAEKSALRGAVQHIKNEKPALLISAYHVPADIFDIPEMIHNMRDDYKYYLRYNGGNQIWPCDYVLFAI